MPVYRNTRTGDVVTVEGPNADAKDGDPRWELVKAEKAPAKTATPKAEKD